MLKITKENTVNLFSIKLLYELNVIKEKIKLFEKKYKKSFLEFEYEVKTSEENFEKWDDYMLWKANIKSDKYIQNQLQQLQNGFYTIS